MTDEHKTAVTLAATKALGEWMSQDPLMRAFDIMPYPGGVTNGEVKQVLDEDYLNIRACIRGRTPQGEPIFSGALSLEVSVPFSDPVDRILAGLNQVFDAGAEALLQARGSTDWPKASGVLH